MLKEKLLEDLKNSMKNKENLRKDVVQMVRAAILQIEKDKQITLDDKQILDVIAKESKKRKDALEEYKKAQRQDLIEQIEKEIEILSEYLPRQLTEQEIEQQLKQIIQDTGVDNIKQMGIVMKQAKEQMGASADGKTINEILRKLLN